MLSESSIDSETRYSNKLAAEVYTNLGRSVAQDPDCDFNFDVKDHIRFEEQLTRVRKNPNEVN